MNNLFMNQKKQKIHKTVIFTGYRCNSRCVFCVHLDKRNITERTTEKIIVEIIKAKQRGANLIEFVGGEVTIRSDVFKIINKVQALGMKSSLATNGRMMAYDDFAKKIAEAGLCEIIFSIHGHNSDTHEKLTSVPGSFEQVIQGYNNAKKYKIPRISINHTIVKPNYKFLEQTANLFVSLQPTTVEMIFVDPNIGGAKSSFDELVPRISEAAPYMRQALQIAKDNNLKKWYVRYVPLCYFIDYLDNVSELYEVASMHTEHIAPEYNNFDAIKSRCEQSRFKPDKCQQCKLFNKCEGIWQEYIAQYGSDELKPII